MPLTIQGIPFSSPQDLFEKAHLDGPLKYASELKEKRYSYSDVPDKGKKIGTIDATSCLGVIYKGANVLYVQHLDGRPLDSFLEILYPNHLKNWEFDKKEPQNSDLERVTIAREQGASEDRNVEAKPTPSKTNSSSGLGIDSRSFQVTLIGGCKMSDSLEKHTKENLENLVKFWKTHLFNIDVQGWTIGDGPTYETLCSDFMVGEEKIYLMQQGEIGKLNLKMKGSLIPQAARRATTILLDHSHYFFVSNSQKTLELTGLKNIEKLRHFAQILIELDDETLLKNYSTTPDMEPPYFPQMMRNMAAYILDQKGIVSTAKIPLLADHPVIALQGEIVKLHSY